jgi:uncharacterized membrane protein YccC
MPYAFRSRFLMERRITYERLTPAIANGVRAAVATLIPFFLAAALGRAELAWMALGGWLGTLADPGGLRTTRVKALGTFAIVGALMVPLSERCGSTVWLATVLLALVAFAGTLARALGPAAATVGTMTAIIAAVGTSKAGSASYGIDALAFAAGALWATLLSSLVWPVSAHRPVRKAIAVVFEKMAEYARALAECADTEEAGAAWSHLALTHHRRIRAAIEDALAIALAVRAARPGESALGGDLRVLLGRSEAQFPRLVALAVELEGMTVDARPPAIATALRTLATTYEAIRGSLVARSDAVSEPARSAPDSAAAKDAKAANASGASDAGGSRLPSTATLLVEKLAVDSERALAFARTVGAGVAVVGDRDAGAERSSHAAILALGNDARDVRDALSFRSVFFRHALRVAIAVSVASVVGHRIAIHPHWVTVTTLAVLQPYPGPTSTRAAERVVGTVLGSLVAALITIFVHAPLALAALMFPLSVAAVATRGRSYRLFTFFLTPVFVLIAERHPGDWWTAAARAGDAVVGGVIALVAALVVLPSWERTRLPEAIDGMVKAVSAYRDAVVASLYLQGPQQRADIERSIAAARRAAGIAIGEAETSLERWLAEPLRRAEQGETAMQLVTHARRLANACTTLDVRALHGVDDAAGRETHLRAIETYGQALVRRATTLT